VACWSYSLVYGVESDKYLTMRIHEIITETTMPGWEEEPKRFRIHNHGEIIIGMRYEENGKRSVGLFHYYDVRIDRELPVFTIRIQGDDVIEYDHRLHPAGKLIGSGWTDDKVEEYFLNGVSSYQNMFLKENRMNTKKVTGADILSMCPGLKEAMDSVLSKCRESHTERVEENTTVNMSPYKEAIQNADSPKNKAAKNKISDLFND
jgi:hypothetical protein